MSQLVLAATCVAFAAATAHTALIPYLSTLGRPATPVTVTGNCRNIDVFAFRLCDGRWRTNDTERQGEVRGTGLHAGDVVLATPAGDTAHLGLSTWDWFLTVTVPEIWLFLAGVVLVRWWRWTGRR